MLLEMWICYIFFAKWEFHYKGEANNSLNQASFIGGRRFSKLKHRGKSSDKATLVKA
jgi:hypothetical protein